jgi:phosphoadenosine phosphosulfate reductase
MSLIEHTLFGDVDKIANSIAALRHFEPPEGYYFANSGSKDSTVVRDLLIRSGVKFDAHYHITTVDPPELVHFIRDNHPETIRERPTISMWRLIEKKMIPPTHIMRYCCAYLKERGGAGRFVVTGVRKWESTKRRKRQQVEACYNDNSKRFLHPIFDWTEADVWEYIHKHSIPYCNLYDIRTEWPSSSGGEAPRAFKRLGCIMCPQQSPHAIKKDMAYWPKVADQYKRLATKHMPI